ncbi:MAG: hypothetical protein MR958_05790 [Spirochaetia bacterium]|nr:hypothetical protein [Spirochaetia bacterium]MDD7269556.1 hypothetical protein [Treponema sp.]MDD7269635.1 hypothetical protein [Treponema sp.]
MEYFCLYVNKPRRFIKVHKGSCGCCKNKKGEHDIPDTENSLWSDKNFDTLEDAIQYGIEKYKIKPDCCKLCIKAK